MVPNSKMPDLAWDIAETQLTQEAQKGNNSNMTPPLHTLVTIIILIIAIVKQTITQIKKIAKKAAQAIENTTKEVSRNKIIKNIKDFHRTITASDSNSNQYDQPYQPQKTSPNKQQNYKILPRHMKTQ